MPTASSFLLHKRRLVDRLHRFAIIERERGSKGGNEMAESETGDKVTIRDLFKSLVFGFLHGTGRVIGAIVVIAAIFYFFPGVREKVVGFFQALFG